MSLARLVRLAGPVSVVAAALIVVTEIVGVILGGSLNAGPVAVANGVVRAFAFFLLLLGLVGLYACQSERAGRLGLVGFLMAFLGTMLLAGDLWFEGFAFPYLMEVAPRVLEGGSPGGTLIAGAGVSFLTFNTGWLLFGIASFRARVFPRVATIVLVVGALLCYPSPLYPPKLVVLAAGVGWMGFYLSTQRGAPAEQAPRVT